MDKRGCMITYPVEGHGKNTIKSAIRLGANKIILMDEDESYKDLFTELGLITDVRPIIKDDASSVVSSAAGLISDAKKEHDDVSVLLLPANPVITTGVYIAACMEKVKVLTPVSDVEMKHLAIPIFPFANLNENEIFVLKKIMEKEEIGARNLLDIIKKECSKILFPEKPGKVKEKSELRYIQRILNKLEKMGLIEKEKKGINFVWKPSSFGKLISGREERKKY